MNLKILINRRLWVGQDRGAKARNGKPNASEGQKAN